MYGVINDGLELMKKTYFGDSMFLVWLDYSRKMLDCGYDVTTQHPYRKLLVNKA